jgi:hypothetical protein
MKKSFEASLKRYLTDDFALPIEVKNSPDRAQKV